MLELGDPVDPAPGPFGSVEREIPAGGAPADSRLGRVEQHPESGSAAGGSGREAERDAQQVARDEPWRSLPRIYEVGAILNSGPDELLAQLALPDHVRQFCATPEGRRVALAEIKAARARFSDYFMVHSSIAIPAAQRMLAEGRGLRSDPPEEEWVNTYSRVGLGNGGSLWISREELPDLFAIKDRMRSLPRELAAALTARTAEAMEQSSGNGAGQIRKAR